MAYQFKVGDTVIVLLECSGTKIGQKYKLLKGVGGALVAGVEVDDDGVVVSGCICQEKWQLVEENKLINKIMNKLKTLFTKLVDPNVAKLSEAGFLNGDLALTNEAREELMNILFLEKRGELLKLAEEILEKRKEECK